MKKAYKLLILLGGLLVLYFFISTSSGITNNDLKIGDISDQIEIQSENELNYRLSVISDSSEAVNFELTQEQESELTAYDLLKMAESEGLVETEVEEYDFGVFVKAINGLKSSKDKAWIYFVNGESAQIAADQLVLKPGDLVEWKYISPSEE